MFLIMFLINLQEKKYLKAMEKVREKQEVAHDEAKFKAEQEALSSQVGAGSVFWVS